MSFIKEVLSFFKSNSFDNDPYGWLTNQISHTAASFTVMYGLGFLFNFKSAALLFGLFWLVWEIRHYLQTRNKRDFFEDMFFELSGIAIYLCTVVFLPLMIIVTIIILINRLKNEQTIKK